MTNLTQLAADLRSDIETAGTTAYHGPTFVVVKRDKLEHIAKVLEDLDQAREDEERLHEQIEAIVTREDDA